MPPGKLKFVGEPASKYLAGFNLQIPDPWQATRGSGGYVVEGPGVNLQVFLTPDPASGEEASKKKAEDQVKVQRAVSGREQTTQGVFKSRLGRPIYWLRYPEGGGGSNTRVICYYVPSAKGHYRMLAQVNTAADTDVDLDQVLDHAAATVQFQDPP